MSQALCLGHVQKHLHPVPALGTHRRGYSLQSVRLVRNPRSLLVRAAELEDYLDSNGVELEDHVGSNGFFTDAFKAALATAVSRQSEPDSIEDYSGNGNGYSAIQDDAMYQPANAHEEEVSASEEVLLTSLRQCQANLHTFTSMARQLEAVIDREKRQVERLQFALEKCRMDNAYYRTLEALADKRHRAP